MRRSGKTFTDKAIRRRLRPGARPSMSGLLHAPTLF
jgi:hypothetical protein